MRHHGKIILTDVDGVLLLWITAFNYWMKRHGYELIDSNAYNIDEMYGLTIEKSKELGNQFNESSAIGMLPPFRDAKEYVRRLHEQHGYTFHCITAIPSDPYTKQQRQKNLEFVFGETAIERLECVETSKNKYPILSEYADSGLLWVEDKGANAIMGRDLGLRSILIDHSYNKDPKYDEGILRVAGWKEIFELATSDEINRLVTV